MSAADYQKGYSAGRRRAQREAEWSKEQFRQRVFLSILPELVRAPWSTGGKTWDSMEQFVEGAWRFADLSMKRS